MKSRIQLVKVLRDVALTGDPLDPDLAVVRRILLTTKSFDLFRYLAGPPVSEDDIYTLAVQRPVRVKKAEIAADDDIARRLYQLIILLHDRRRFPWFPVLEAAEDDPNILSLVQPARLPTRTEIRNALRSTAVLHAAQALATERRSYGREVERKLRDKLTAIGLKKVPARDKGKISDADAVPAPGTFYGECTFYGRRVDLLIGLPKRYVIAVESKDSSSAVNSVKRLSNDTGAKARIWEKGYGQNATSVALISGVYHPDTLRKAQETGLKLVWAHRMGEFVDWVRERCGIPLVLPAPSVQ